MTEKYIRAHFDNIKRYANVIEQRLDDSDCTMEHVLADNDYYKEFAKRYKESGIMIDDSYEIDL